MLLGVKYEGHGYYTVHPDYKVETATSMDDPTSPILGKSSEYGDTIEVDTGSTQETDTPIVPIESRRSIEEDGTYEENEMSTHDSGDTEAEKHAAAYVRMTRLAAPLSGEAGPSAWQSHTPSKKRHRAIEIADSDSSSRNATISPRRVSDAASDGRHLRRLATPEDNRRVSAPSHFGDITYHQANSPKRRRLDDSGSTPAFKDEAWVEYHPVLCDYNANTARTLCLLRYE